MRLERARGGQQQPVGERAAGQIAVRFPRERGVFDVPQHAEQIHLHEQVRAGEPAKAPRLISPFFFFQKIIYQYFAEFIRRRRRSRRKRFTSAARARVKITIRDYANTVSTEAAAETSFMSRIVAVIIISSAFCGARSKVPRLDFTAAAVCQSDKVPLHETLPVKRAASGEGAK